MKHKHCNTCSKTKPVSDFGKRAASLDGLAHKCKSCQSIYDRERANLPHRIKARENYLKTDRGREASNRAKKAYIERNTVKRAAHIIVGNAIRDGKLLRAKTCECCRKKKKTEAHHDDYSQPLKVRWLCSACHNQWHKQQRGQNNA